ncbi:Hypothetical predicted protein [Mytilus galloprovincialis]|uniref:Uncharacterized protein n=1 Tax=Mytilus galloprovincialis TaxID=29158 RepID=A0A8B6FCJ3_MYTGA|nr:Hypothetical predicted protein [Mytilus galloprovincialis]
MKSYKAIIYQDGTVYYNFPTLIESICPIDVTSFPFDSQMCPLVFGSWVYHGLQLDIQPRNNPGDLSSMKKNVEWIISNVEVERHVLKYGCCPEPYPDITFYIYLHRKPAYYVTNIIIPSVIITVLAILGYFLPVESGEKASLVITIMLSLSVFQLLVADKLPPSADATPWLTVYCTTSPVKNVSDVIFADYDSSLRPVCSGTTQVNATLGIALRQVIELDEPNQVIKLNLWIRLKWNDCLLQWDPNDFDGITNIIVPYKKIWVPDLTLYDR